MMLDLWKHFLQVLFYIVHLYVFYGAYLIPFGRKIALKCAGTWSCHRRLTVDSTFGHQLDLSDGQWRDFRQYITLFVVVGVVSVLADRAFLFIMKALYPAHHKQHRLAVKMAVGLISVIIQHSYHSLIILILALIGFYVPRISSNRTLATVLVWAFALSILLFKESYRLLRYPQYAFLSVFFDPAWAGLYRWQLPANFLALRVLSYGIDHLRSKQPVAIESDGKDKPKNPADHMLSAEDDTLLNYLAYVLYAPLYMAGPVITFNAFILHSHTPYRSWNTWMYALRWIACYMVMEYMLNQFPVFAVLHSGLLPHLHVYEVAAVCYLLLKIMWLKFLLIWRFFRCWAMFDGVDPPENMLRCMSNNYSLEQFWKGWHASYNKWLVRYIYKPLGGSKYRIVTAFVIFFFVALWHDCEVHLLVWGAMNGVFYALEVLLKPLTGYHKRKELQDMSFWRTILCSVVSAGYILILMAVNLIGYSFGTGGMTTVTNKLLTYEGLKVVLFAVYVLAGGVHLMFYLQKIGLVKDFS